MIIVDYPSKNSNSRPAPSEPRLNPTDVLTLCRAYSALLTRNKGSLDSLLQELASLLGRYNIRVEGEPGSIVPFSPDLHHPPIGEADVRLITPAFISQSRGTRHVIMKARVRPALSAPASVSYVDVHCDTCDPVSIRYTRLNRARVDLVYAALSGQVPCTALRIQCPTCRRQAAAITPYYIGEPRHKTSDEDLAVMAVEDDNPTSFSTEPMVVIVRQNSRIDLLDDAPVSQNGVRPSRSHPVQPPAFERQAVHA